jgi:pimeloyl-ACP methyl ester carboxylesterase
VLLAVVTFATAASAQAPQEKSVSVFGAKINYIEAGDPAKPKVILLHGLGGSVANWQLTIPALAKDYHVIAPDQVGFGKSDKPLLKYRVGTYADFLDRFMAVLKLEKASLVGNSMGGWIAGLMAIRYPNRVDKMVLVDAAGILPKEYNEADIYQLNNSTREEIRANMKKLFATPALRDSEALVDQFMEGRVTAGDGYTINSLIESIRRKEDFLNDRLGAIKKPTLIVWGKQDGLIPVSDAAIFQKGIAGSQVLILDNAGHAPQIEKPVEFMKALSDFLAAK